MASEVGYDPTSTRVNSTPSFPFDYSELGGEQGCRSPPANLARIGSAPARSPYWCPAPDSNRPPPRFKRPQSPDLLTGRIGAVSGGRSRASALAMPRASVVTMTAWWARDGFEPPNPEGTTFTAWLLWPLAYSPTLVAESRIRTDDLQFM